MRAYARCDPEFVGAERQLEEVVAADLVAEVENRVTLLRRKVLPILHHRSTAPVYGAGIVDGVAVLVIGSKGNAVLQPLVQAHRSLVVL